MQLTFQILRGELFWETQSQRTANHETPNLLSHKGYSNCNGTTLRIIVKVVLLNFLCVLLITQRGAFTVFQESYYHTVHLSGVCIVSRIMDCSLLDIYNCSSLISQTVVKHVCVCLFMCVCVCVCYLSYIREGTVYH